MLSFQKGDKAAFEKLVEKHCKRVFNIANRFLNNKEAAEDLNQDVFVKIYNAASSYRPAAKFQTWVYQIVRNACLNELRRRKKPVFSIDQTIETEDHEIKKELQDQMNPTPQEAAWRKETGDVIKEAIQSLPENQRLAVILQRYENLSYEDIAKTLNCSVKAVKSLLNRAKENLKEKLSPFMKETHS